MALNSVGEQFFDLWDCWSRLGAKFVEPDCESRWSGFDSDGGISVATLLYHARKANWDQQQAEKAFVAELKLLIKEGILDSLDPAISVIQFFASRDSRQTIRLRSLLKRELALPKGEFNELHGQALTEDGEPNGLTHGEMGSHLLSKIELTPGHVTGWEMQFWRCESGIWRPVPMRRAQILAEEFVGQPLCRRQTDYVSITKNAYSKVEDPIFFNEMAVGLATEQHLYHVVDGKLVKEPILPDHRVRFPIAIEPVEGEFPLFNKTLQRVLGHDPSQINLFQESMGALFFGLLCKHRRMILFIGPTRTGKSRIAKMLLAMFPKSVAASLPPYLWDKEDRVVNLAGMAINVVPELDEDEVLPSGPVKSIDLVNHIVTTQLSNFLEPRHF